MATCCIELFLASKGTSNVLAVARERSNTLCTLGEAILKLVLSRTTNVFFYSPGRDIRPITTTTTTTAPARHRTGDERHPISYQ